MVTALSERLRVEVWNFRGQFWPSAVGSVGSSGLPLQSQPPSRANQLKQRHTAPSFLPRSIVQAVSLLALVHLSRRPQPMSAPVGTASANVAACAVLWAAHNLNSVSSLASTTQQ